MQEWERGRFGAAREHFDAVIEFMLALPEGARGEPRLEAHFEQLLDRISALELLGLRERRRADGVAIGTGGD